MPITSLPTPPSRTDAANFSARADAFLGALPTFGTEANALAVEVNGYATNAAASAATAVNAPGTSATSTTSTREVINFFIKLARPHRGKTNIPCHEWF